MRDQVHLLRAAARVTVAVACAAILGCGGDDGGSVNATPTPTPVEIIVQPQDQTVTTGSSATFSVQFSGPPLSFNWTKGGEDIPGATSLTYTTPPAVPSDDGLTYGARWVFPSSRPVVQYSRMATLTVVPPVPAVPGVFQPTGSMVTPRAGHTATLLPNGKVLIVGGGTFQLGLSPAAAATSAELYDPATGTFTATGSMSGARFARHTATLLSDGRVLVSGGEDYNSHFEERVRSDAEIYDPVTGRFASTGSMGARRANHVAVLLGNGKVLIAGGFDNAASTAELFDPATGTFSPTSSMPPNRYGGAAGALLGDGRALALGVDAVGGLFDPVQSVFSATGSAQTAGGVWSELSLATLADGRVLAVGGREQGSTPSEQLVANARVFDPTTNLFTLTGALIWPRAGTTATPLPDGRVLVFGGYGDGRWPDRGELFDPGSGTFAATVSAGAGRAGHTATLLQTGKVLIAGGQGGTSQRSISSTTGSLLFDPL